jgi:hypothetical protein
MYFHPTLISSRRGGEIATIGLATALWLDTHCTDVNLAMASGAVQSIPRGAIPFQNFRQVASP